MTWWADYNLTYSRRHQCQRVQARCRRVGQHHQPVRRELSGREAQADCRRRAARAAPQPARGQLMRGASRLAREERGSRASRRRAFFEYHLYTLGRPTTLPDNSTKQIELFPAARNVPCEKTLVYYGLPPATTATRRSPLTDRNLGVQSNKKVDVYLGFKNAPGAQHGHAAAVRPHAREQARPAPTTRSNSSART